MVKPHCTGKRGKRGGDQMHGVDECTRSRRVHGYGEWGFRLMVPCFGPMNERCSAKAIFAVCS
jgi:hypothetical protein